jgi:hypothetical protein
MTQQIKCLQCCPRGSEKIQELLSEISREKDILLDEALVQLLCIPVFQEKHNSVVGNRVLTFAIWSHFQGLLENGKEDLDSTWRSHT